MDWQKEKPDYACVFVAKDREGDYELFRFEWELSEDSNFEETEDGTIENISYCLAWLDKDGYECDDYGECNYDEYLVLEKLPTMEEVHKKHIEELLKEFNEN